MAYTDFQADESGCLSPAVGQRIQKRQYQDLRTVVLGATRPKEGQLRFDGRLLVFELDADSSRSYTQRRVYLRMSMLTIFV